MTKLLPECSKCSSPVTDSLETEIEQHGKVKTGRYADGRWMCHDCIEGEEIKKRAKEQIILLLLLLINVIL